MFSGFAGVSAADGWYTTAIEVEHSMCTDTPIVGGSLATAYGLRPPAAYGRGPRPGLRNRFRGANLKSMHFVLEVRTRKLQLQQKIIVELIANVILTSKGYVYIYTYLIYI